MRLALTGSSPKKRHEAGQSLTRPTALSGGWPWVEPLIAAGSTVSGCHIDSTIRATGLWVDDSRQQQTTTEETQKRQQGCLLRFFLADPAQRHDRVHGSGSMVQNPRRPWPRGAFEFVSEHPGRVRVFMTVIGVGTVAMVIHGGPWRGGERSGWGASHDDIGAPHAKRLVPLSALNRQAGRSEQDLPPPPCATSAKARKMQRDGAPGATETETTVGRHGEQSNNEMSPPTPPHLASSQQPSNQGVGGVRCAAEEQSDISSACPVGLRFSSGLTQSKSCRLGTCGTSRCESGEQRANSALVQVPLSCGGVSDSFLHCVWSWQGRLSAHDHDHESMTIIMSPLTATTGLATSSRGASTMVSRARRFLTAVDSSG
ncbi:hypothetical protein B0J13DRAFT_519324 [Dactylonectria estremocensis]|uniref:Uncharacterized protein n=1 Tax=Dactylonectria estremocensis TaxID=1079267 RepID=A0A9P9FCL5_9HYPO|nr:hypothetical protein B0J13DRAFT_519324 [Dactylonectria estremocensis]